MESVGFKVGFNVTVVQLMDLGLVEITWIV